jgi:putative glutamine amidotransferase
MNAPRVALTTSVDDIAGSHGRPSVFLYTSYIEALQQIGVAPVLITPTHNTAAIAALMDACCGLVLTGGEDVDPRHYGEAPSPALGAIEPARDEMEFRALRAALEREMPVFGICRGAQLLNVHFGGSLYQDLKTERPTDLAHDQTEPWDRRTHNATVRTDTLLHNILGDTRLFINSFHHQAVKDVGRELRIAAIAEDGLIEAIEHERLPWVLGVQWHPERNEASAPDTDPDRRLFVAFREAVAQYDCARI